MQNTRVDLHKRLYDYALAIVRFVEKLPKDSVSQTLGRQLLRSGTSVSANIVEAGSASSKKDYINFFTHALKSANESKFWISLLKDSGKCSSESAETILKETAELANILGASVKTMKANLKNKT